MMKIKYIALLALVIPFMGCVTEKQVPNPNPVVVPETHTVIVHPGYPGYYDDLGVFHSY